MGYAQNDGPLTFTEINAWADATGRGLDPWMVKVLRDASEAFLRGKIEPECPWHEPDTASAQAGERVRGMLGRLRGAG